MATPTTNRPAQTQTASAGNGAAAAFETHPSAERPAPSGRGVDPNAFPDAFADIDAVEHGTPRPTPTPAAAPAKPAPAAPAKPAADAPTKPTTAAPAKADAPAAKPGEATKLEDAASAPLTDDAAKAATSEFRTAHDLRKAFLKRGDEITKLTTELTQLREQSKRPESNPQTQVLLEENKTLKSQLDKLDEEMRYVEFTKSNEFRDKFEVPLQNALADAYEEIKEFPVTMEDGTTRAGTAADFDRLITAPPEHVRVIAKELFGDMAPDAINMRRKIVDIRRAANREAARYREEAKSRESERLSKQVSERETMEKLWRKANEDVVAKFPQYFGKVDGDDELNATLEKGYAIVDKAHDPNLPMEEKAERLAVLRHKAAAFSTLQLRLKRASDRIKELEEVVAGYENSEPTEGKAQGKGGAPTTEPGMPEGYVTADSMIEAMESAAG